MMQIKTIINFVAVFFCFSLSALQVRLEVKDSQGKKLDQVQVGKPFVLEVIVNDAQSHSIEPKIMGGQHLILGKGSCRFSSVNNKTNISISYVARCSVSGSHSVGPVEVQDGGRSSQSDVLIIKAGTQEVAHSCEVDQERPPMFVTLSADQESVVAGQRLEGTITFFYRTPVERLLTLNGSSVDGFLVDESSMEQGSEYVDGHKYNCASWDWHLYAKHPGQLVIPACSLDVAVRQDDDVFGHFPSFFGPQLQRVRLDSNALTVDIEALPSYGLPVDAVGRFENFSAKLNQATAKEGDAIVVTLSIDGDADLENLNLELQEVPHVFKSYSSKKNIDKKKHASFATRCCEHIIQGMEPGEWELPEQSFTFFDIDSYTYKTLKTAPLLVRILPQTTKKTFVPPSVDEIAPAITIDTTGQVEETRLKLNMNGHWNEIPERKMPWWLFMVFVSAPIGILLSGQIEKWFRRYIQKQVPKTEWRNAFANAHKKLKLAKKKKDFPALYRILVDLFAIRCSVDHAKVSDQMIKQVLASGGFSAQELVRWDRFFSDVSAFVFYTVEGAESQTSLFDQADKWVTQLEGVI